MNVSRTGPGCQQSKVTPRPTCCENAFVAAEFGAIFPTIKTPAWMPGFSMWKRALRHFVLFAIWPNRILASSRLRFPSSLIEDLIFTSTRSTHSIGKIGKPNFRKNSGLLQRMGGRIYVTSFNYSNHVVKIQRQHLLFIAPPQPPTAAAPG